MTQAVWTTAHGHPLVVTSLRGEQIVRLAAHVDPILVAFAPFWWLWPSPELLLAVQATAVALGAPALFLLARKHLGSERAALGFALAYLLWPAVEWLTLNEFHPVALATPLLLWAFWFLDQDRLALFALCALAAATAKEEIPLVVATLGLWYGVTRRRWGIGAGIALAGVLWTVVAVKLVIPHFNNGGESAFSGRYGDVGESAAVSSRGLHYLWQLAAPTAGLFLLAPLAAAAALPELALNLLSRTEHQSSIHFHYVAGEIPPLAVASVLGAGRLARRRPQLAGRLGLLAVAAALAANWHFGAIPFWSHIPGGEDYQARDWHVSRHDRIAARALRLIPDDAVVTATNTLGAHLSARRRILSFPRLDDATWAAVDTKKLSYRDSTRKKPARRALDRLRRRPHWRLAYSNDGVLLFRR